MTNEIEFNTPQENGNQGSCLMWSCWVATLSLSTVCVVSLLIVFVASLGLNAYLAWEISGVEVIVNGPAPTASRGATSDTTLLSDALVLPTDTTEPEPSPTPTATPTNPATKAPTRTSTTQPTQAATATPTATLNPTDTPSSISPSPTAVAGIFPTSTVDWEAYLRPTPVPFEIVDQESAAETETVDQESAGIPASAVITSENNYALIPLEGKREGKPAAEHGDLNLALRDPQPVDGDLLLLDIPKAGIDADGPKLSALFEPNFRTIYTIHNWDWTCDCKGELLQTEYLTLAGVVTTPGTPLYIPPREQDIYGGAYYAVVLYASEDSLTFSYSRSGSVVEGYTIHYQGLQTDPNLIALFQQSPEDELPGLTLDTPVGTATDELVVAIRDRGTFLDVRSKRDWWE